MYATTYPSIELASQSVISLNCSHTACIPVGIFSQFRPEQMEDVRSEANCLSSSEFLRCHDCAELTQIAQQKLPIAKQMHSFLARDRTYVDVQLGARPVKGSGHSTTTTILLEVP